MIPLSPAAKVELITSLMYQPIFDEWGDFAGYEPIGQITEAEARELLGFPPQLPISDAIKENLAPNI